jgi:hypothetical protein
MFPIVCFAALHILNSEVGISRGATDTQRLLVRVTDAMRGKPVRDNHLRFRAHRFTARGSMNEHRSCRSSVVPIGHCGRTSIESASKRAIRAECSLDVPAAASASHWYSITRLRIWGSGVRISSCAPVNPESSSTFKRWRNRVFSDCNLCPHYVRKIDLSLPKIIPRVAMMQSGKDWCGNDSPTSLHSPS